MKIEVWPVFKLKISTGLHHYLDTIPRTDKRVIAINIGMSIYIPRRYIGLLLYKLRFMCPILASYVDILILKNYN